MKFIKLIVDLHEEVYNNMVIKNEYTERDVIAVHNALMDAAFMRSSFLDHERKFESIIVEYPPEESCIYPEYKGKPYFSIQYEEKGEHIIGFGTYNPEVLSRYLIEYFILPTMIKADDTTRDCKTCKHSNNGKCAGTEECHDCMWDSKYEQQPNEDCISRQAVNTLVDELARAISDERCCMSRGRSTATIMQDILDLPPVTPQPFINKPYMKAR